MARATEPRRGSGGAGASVRPGAAVLVVVAALAAGGSVRAQERRPPPDAGEGNCLTSGCHGDLAEGRVIHAPVELESCEACHDATGEGHRFATPDPVAEACLMCHDDPASAGGHVHGPVAAGDCTACHDPHHAPREKLLRDDLPALCWRCHARVQTWDGRRAVRDVKGEIDRAETVHDAVELGCDTCHPPHASGRAGLFTESFPAGPYAAGIRGNYDLCFSCHDESLVDPAASDTGFRDGEKNLHAVHVNREKSRRCAFCHSPHGGGLHLIRETTPFGTWDLPIGFTALADGGRCATACHEPREYHRGDAEQETGP